MKRKSLVLVGIVVVVMMVVMVIGRVKAEDVVEVKEIPFKYIGSTERGGVVTQKIVFDTKKVKEIKGFEFELYGDYQRNTRLSPFIRIEGKVYYCEPLTWTTPRGAYGYKTFFDCVNVTKKLYDKFESDRKKGKKGKKGGGLITLNEEDLAGVRVSEKVSNMYGTLKIKYVVAPEIKAIIHGTDYEGGQTGKVFLQLLDSEYKEIDNATCFASIYYPDNTLYKYQQQMVYIGEGIYAYDVDVPYVQGVYPVSGYCILPSIPIEENAYDGFESGDGTGGTGWYGNWVLDGCNVVNTYGGAEGSTYYMECRNDKEPYREIESNSSMKSVTYDFWWRAYSLESADEVYYIIEDADGTQYTILTLSDGDDDDVWYRETGTLTDSFDGFNFSGRIKFMVSTNGNLGNGDYYEVDEINLTLNGEIPMNDSKYQVIRGSGELNVKSENEYYVTLEYGTLTNETFNGYMYLYYKVKSGTAVNKSEQDVHLDLWNAFPCDQVNGVYLKNKTTGQWQNVTWYTELNWGSNDRCTVHYIQDLETKENYEVYVNLSNFWRINVLGKSNVLELDYDVIHDGCYYYQQNKGYANYTVPLEEEPTENDTFYLACQYYFDMYYRFNDTLNNKFVLHPQGETNYTIEQMKGLEGVYQILLDEAWLLQELMGSITNVWQQSNDYSHTILGGGSSYESLTFFANVSASYTNFNEISKINTTNTAREVWNYSNRTLTYYPPAEVNNTEVAEAVWGYNGSISQVILDFIAKVVWNWEWRNLTYYEDETNYTMMSDVVWNYSNGRYINGKTDSY